MHSLFKDNSVYIRLLRPEFEYSTPLFKHEDALYYSTENIVFIATKRQSSNYGENIYTELAIWYPEEIQLLAALTLSRGRVKFAPWWDSILPDSSLDTNLSSKDTVRDCLDTAKTILYENEKSSTIHYSLYKTEFPNADLEKNLFDNIDPSWGLLLRGLYTLMKSELLMHAGHIHDFMEESFIDLQISCEAALTIIREHLLASGNPNAGFKEVHNYIKQESVPSATFVKYLKTLYESWIETKHPYSAYGANWAPSLSADDVFETWDVLFSIYRHIIIEEPIGQY